MLFPLSSRWPTCPRHCSAWRTRCSGWAIWRARSPIVRRPVLASAAAVAGRNDGEYGDRLTAGQISCMTIMADSSCFDLERTTQCVQSPQRFIELSGCPFLYAEGRTYSGQVPFGNGDGGGAETLLAE